MVEAKSKAQIKVSQMDSDHPIVQWHHSVLEVDSTEWQDFIDDQDLAMNRNMIYLQEKTLAGQAQSCVLTVHLRKKLVACACLALFETDILQSAPYFLQKLVKKIRKKIPHLFKKNVLFCGLPVPSGENHLRIASFADYHSILQLLIEQTEKLAKEKGAELIVFKEFPKSQLPSIDFLKTLGFYRGELAPIFCLARSFDNFGQYQSSLRSGYRRQMKFNIEKFNKSGLKVTHLLQGEIINASFTPSVYQLYLNVWDRAKEKLECFPIEFFLELPKLLPHNTVLTLISDQDKPVAFAFGLITDKAYYNIYGGLNYTYNTICDLYFNLFYQELDLAFSLKKTDIYLGQTADSFKSRLGAEPQERYFFMKPLSLLMRIVFKLFSGFIFPKIPKPDPKKVFKD